MKGTPLESIALQPTSTYGIREYSHGSRLLQHVDRIATHACSVIAQIGQVDMLEPWPLEIYDHAGRMHEVSMAPGDLLFYESAKNIHSRVRPMLGAQFANIFAHYRPLRRDPQTKQLQGDEKWYERENVLGTVKAITAENVAAAAFEITEGGSRATNGFDATGSDGVTPKREKDKEHYATMFLSEEEIELLQPYKEEDDREAWDVLYDIWSKYNCPGTARNCADFMPHYKNRVHQNTRNV